MIFKTVLISQYGHRRYFFESNHGFEPSSAKFFDIML